jgi:hypothetical protein
MQSYYTAGQQCNDILSASPDYYLSILLHVTPTKHNAYAREMPVFPNVLLLRPMQQLIDRPGIKKNVRHAVEIVLLLATGGKKSVMQVHIGYKASSDQKRTDIVYANAVISQCYRNAMRYLDALQQTAP